MHVYKYAKILQLKKVKKIVNLSISKIVRRATRPNLTQINLQHICYRFCFSSILDEALNIDRQRANFSVLVSFNFQTISLDFSYSFLKTFRTPHLKKLHRVVHQRYQLLVLFPQQYFTNLTFCCTSVHILQLFYYFHCTSEECSCP